MIHLHIICLGKLKEQFWREAESEYIKRLRPFTKLTIYELREESFSEKDKAEIVKQKEAIKILRELERIGETHILALDERGKQFSSVAFSEHLMQLAERGKNSITLVIGGPLGLDESIVQKAHLRLGLSSFTFTHQMARIILLEQLYRAMMIHSKRKYHY